MSPPENPDEKKSADGKRHLKSAGRPKRPRMKRLRRRKLVNSRRKFLVLGGTLLAAGAALSVFRLRMRHARALERGRRPVRPPTAGFDDAAFQAACIRCGLCGTVCENGCIKYFGVDEPEHGVFTPYVDVRRRSCTLCMRCTQICPTNALTHVDEDLPLITEEVSMGTAVVDPDRCLSYLGRVCGYCYDACPLPGTAIRLVPPAKPVVIVEGCVGCGRCVELCPQSPTAIDVFAADIFRQVRS